MHEEGFIFICNCSASGKDFGEFRQAVDANRGFPLAKCMGCMEVSEETHC